MLRARSLLKRVNSASLLAAVVSEHLLELDEDQQELVPKLLRDARKGLTVPRIAMRYRLQTDTHGLDRSRHRIVDETFGGDRRRVILELDKHSRPDPQLIGAIMAIATMPPGAREIGLRAIERVLRSPGQLPEGMTVRRMYEGIPGARLLLLASSGHSPHLEAPAAYVEALFGFFRQGEGEPT